MDKVRLATTFGNCSSIISRWLVLFVNESGVPGDRSIQCTAPVLNGRCDEQMNRTVRNRKYFYSRWKKTVLLL
jgi:hypothetical protein